MRTGKGLFVTFEGIDGSGKSTQVTSLRRSLEDKGIQVIVIREPGGTRIGEKIRSILLDKANTDMSSRTELMLYEAARSQIVDEVILPSLKEGKVVICDRFFDSTIAYQGYARGVDLEAINLLNQFAAGGLQPDLTFLLDLPVKAALDRIHIRVGEKDRLELEGYAFMENVRSGYLAWAGKNKRIVTLDAMSPASVMAEYIDSKFWEVFNT